jgi:glycosyltransferase involved in cell wall biosynthesis
MMAGEKFIVITAARNEQKYLGKMIKSLLSQTVLPCEWVIVDDGSVDETYRIAQDAARGHSWIKIIRRPDRGYRDLGGGLVDVFYEGLNHISNNDYQYIFNIDADIILGPDYFKKILAKFAENPKLGIGGGVVYDDIQGQKVRLRARLDLIRGAIKGWRRECFQEIGGLVRGTGWDALDCVKAIMSGWHTETYEDAGLEVLHLRPEKSSIKNRYLGWTRHGKALHFAGAHPVWLLASAMYHMLDRPYVMGGLCMIIGYLEEQLKGSQQYGGQEFRRSLRAWHKQELARRLRLKWLPGISRFYWPMPPAG